MLLPKFLRGPVAADQLPVSTPDPATDPVEALYNGHCQSTRHSTACHLPRLRQYATGCDLAIEFGTRHGASASALLLGARRVISYDLEDSAHLPALARAAGARWTFRQQDTREAPVTPCELLFLDSRHTYAHLAAELARHAKAVTRWLIFHDTMTFGSIGAAGESGCPSFQLGRGETIPRSEYGIRLAIDELQIRDPSWRLVAHHPESHGLLILERRP